MGAILLMPIMALAQSYGTGASSSMNSNSDTMTTTAMPMMSNGNSNCTIVTRNLAVGSTDQNAGNEVRALQQFLSDQGFTISIVGRFGPMTRDAVRKFQSAHGIPATGFVGPMTRNIIVQLKCNGASNSQNNSTSILDTKTVQLDEGMRKLWEDHIQLTRMFIIEFAGNLPATSTTAARLLKNQEDIGNAIKPYYGDAAGNQLTALLKAHIVGAVDLLNAAKSGDQARIASSSAAWYANGQQIADFLSSANPTNWPQGMMREHMKEHLDTTLTEATHQLQGNYGAAMDDYDIVTGKILQLADVLTRGIIAQFPDKFR